MMTAIELFGVVIRTTGFLVTVYGIYTLFYGFLYAFWPHYWADSKDDVRAGQYFFAAIIEIVLGIAIISQADSIASLAY